VLGHIVDARRKTTSSFQTQARKKMGVGFRGGRGLPQLSARVNAVERDGDNRRRGFVWGRAELPGRPRQLISLHLEHTTTNVTGTRPAVFVHPLYFPTRPARGRSRRRRAGARRVRVEDQRPRRTRFVGGGRGAAGLLLPAAVAAGEGVSAPLVWLELWVVG